MKSSCEIDINDIYKFKKKLFRDQKFSYAMIFKLNTFLVLEENRSNEKLVLEVIRILSELNKSKFFADILIKIIFDTSAIMKNNVKLRRLTVMNSGDVDSEIFRYYLNLVKFHMKNNAYFLETLQLLQSVLKVIHPLYFHLKKKF